MTKRLIILRGLPGSGKSTLAKQLLIQDSDILHEPEPYEADDFFVQPDGTYVWDQARHGEAHATCQARVIEAMCHNTSLVVVSNTHSRMWEYMPYLQAARLGGYDVEIREIVCRGLWELNRFHERNIHDVPMAACAAMWTRWEVDEQATLYTADGERLPYHGWISGSEHRSSDMRAAGIKLGDSEPDPDGVNEPHMLKWSNCIVPAEALNAYLQPLWGELIWGLHQTPPERRPRRRKRMTTLPTFFEAIIHRAEPRTGQKATPYVEVEFHVPIEVHGPIVEVQRFADPHDLVGLRASAGSKDESPQAVYRRMYPWVQTAVREGVNTEVFAKEVQGQTVWVERDLKGRWDFHAHTVWLKRRQHLEGVGP